MASITCKKCSAAYSDTASKCPKCQYPTEMNDPFMWFEDDEVQNTSESAGDKIVDRYRATQVENAAETFDDSNTDYIGDDYEATVVQDIEEDVYEDSVVEVESKVYEVPEVMPDVYEMSENDYDIYEASEIEYLPDSYVDDIPDEVDDIPDEVDDVPDKIDDDNIDDITGEEDVFNEDSWYDEEEADIYEDSQIEVFSENQSEINPNAWSEEERVNVHEEDEQLSVSHCKCPRCHTAHRFISMEQQYIYEKRCDTCQHSFRFSEYVLVDSSTKKQGQQVEHHWQLQGKAVDKIDFVYKEKIAISNNEPLLLIYGRDLKSRQEKLSIISTGNQKYFILHNIKRAYDVRGAVIAIVLVPFLFFMISFLHNKNSIVEENTIINKEKELSEKQLSEKQLSEKQKTSTKTVAEKIKLMIKPKIYAKEGYIYVLGQTNFPSGTQLEISINKEYGKKVGRATAIVHNNTFQALKIPATTVVTSEGQQIQKLYEGSVIVTLYCDLYRSWKEKSAYAVLKNYEGKYIKKEKQRRGYSKKLEMKKKIVVSNKNESKEASQYKLQLWAIKDIATSKKWNSNYYVRKLGTHLQYDPSQGDKNIEQCFYFPKANITFIVNLYYGTIKAWRIGKHNK